MRHLSGKLNCTAAAMLTKYSPYICELEEAEKVRYTQKLDKLGRIDDPFVQEPRLTTGVLAKCGTP